MIDTGSIAASLADPPSSSVIAASTDWISHTLIGSIATTIAVISVATIGFMMLEGRYSLRHGLNVLIGCFILFGAVTIANGLRAISTSSDGGAVEVNYNSEKFNGSGNGAENKTRNDPDPYAGASISR